MMRLTTTQCSDILQEFAGQNSLFLRSNPRLDFALSAGVGALFKQIPEEPIDGSLHGDHGTYCGQCGSSLHSSFRYCPACGQKVLRREENGEDE